MERDHIDPRTQDGKERPDPMSNYIKSNAADYMDCANFLYKTACFVQDNPNNPAYKKDFKAARKTAKEKLSDELEGKHLNIAIRKMMLATVLHLPEDEQDLVARQRAKVVYEATLQCGK